MPDLPNMLSPYPLSGIKVLELARILAGPWLGQTLADLGADVVKVESPAGDDTRRWGPPFIHHRGESAAAYFHCCNRGKRSLVADLKTPTGVEHVRHLAACADVIIENFKVGGLRQYGLDYVSVAADNPSVVYCSITGAGQTGPDAERLGYDFLAQGRGGIMSVTGEEGGEPQKIGVALADIITGLYGVIGVQAALWRRISSGVGQHIDLSLLDSVVGVLANQAANYFAFGKSPTQLGNMHPNIAPYQVVKVADGYVIIAVGNDAQFGVLCETLSVSWATEARFATNAARVENRLLLADLLTQVLHDWTKDSFITAMVAAGVPAGPINTIADVFADPQVRYRGMQVNLDGVATVRSPLVFSEDSLCLEKPSPKLGEHTDEVLREWSVRIGA